MTKLDEPQKLYRFRSIKNDETNDGFDRAKGEIENAILGKVWFSKLDSQNDLLDSNFVIENSSDEEFSEAISAFQKIHGMNTSLYGPKIYDNRLWKNRPWPKAKKREMYWQECKDNSLSWVDRFRKSSICCFNLDLASMVMWGLYSDCHRGFVLEFQVTDNELPVNFISDRVKYFSQRPIVRSHEFVEHSAAHLEQKNGTKRHVPPAFFDTSVRGILLGHKSEEWKFEQEYRFSDIEGKTGFQDLIKWKLVRIIVGKNTPNKIEDCIRSCAGDIPVIRARLHNTEYKVVVGD
ncbi:DUF2971 domain-containing protein [Pacificibacter sp. AS14]|uniref:DUF2971 domain-containing protein n=1 Tax=Pacificibacter sp. AS14 TaxID=3135785 RepID=UPI0031805836